MMTIAKGSIEMRGTDAEGEYAMAQDSSGDWCGVSLRGSDEVVRDLSELRVGMLIEVGTEHAVVGIGVNERPLNRLGEPSSDAEMMADAEAAAEESRRIRNGGLP